MSQEWGFFFFSLLGEIDREYGSAPVSPHCCSACAEGGKRTSDEGRHPFRM